MLKSKRLLVVSPCFPPDGSPGTHRVVRFVRHLSEAGWSVHVLTIAPASYRPGVPVDPSLLRLVPPGVEVVRTHAFRGLDTVARLRSRLRKVLSGPGPSVAAGAPGTPARPPVSRWQAVKDAVTDAFSLPDDESGWIWSAVPAGVSVARRRRIDLILSSAPPFTAHVVAGAIARLAGVGWVADFRDPWCRSPWARKGLERGWQRAIHERLEHATVERARAVVLATPQMEAEFARHYGGARATRFRTIPNGFDRDRLEPFRALRPTAAGPFTIVHAGSLYGHRDPRPLLEALASLIRSGSIAREQIRVDFIGSVSPDFAVAAALDRLALNGTVTLSGSVPHDESLRRLAAADVVLLIQPRTDVQVPAKLYEYMGLGRPVLALAGPGAVAELVERGRLGLVVSPDDAVAIGEAILSLFRQRGRLSSLFQPDEAFVRQFDGSVTASRLVALLDELVVSRAAEGGAA